jgi:D-alanyl-D-alanine endopeptidase (penicillin-binding protein 7)
MRSSKAKDLSLAVLVAALVAGAGLVPLAYHYGMDHRPGRPATSVAGGPPAVVRAPAPGTGTDVESTTPAPPGTEVVPAEEAESDHGPAAASPAGPTLSFARAAGLHLLPDPAHLNSSAALVMDQDSGQLLFQKNAEAVLPIASLTKLMTTLLVLEAKQPMDEVLTITEDDVDTERHSRSRLRVGTKLTREEALHLALMSSENRAAHALGRSYPGGLPKLVEAMNARARLLGMKNTTYVDPTGLSNRNQSTARDLSLLVAAAAKNPVMREFSTTPAHLASLGGRTLQYKNSNRLVRSESGVWDIELQKTGYIVEAGRCLTMATKVGGHNLVMVLLDADTNGARLGDAERLRRFVVAQNGWQEQPVVAKARAEPERKTVAAKDEDAKQAKEQKTASAGHRKGGKGKKEVAVAKADRDHGKGAAAEAKAGHGKRHAVVAKAEGGKPKADAAKSDGAKGDEAKADAAVAKASSKSGKSGKGQAVASKDKAKAKSGQQVAAADKSKGKDKDKDATENKPHRVRQTFAATHPDRKS